MYQILLNVLRFGAVYSSRYQKVDRIQQKLEIPHRHTGTTKSGNLHGLNLLLLLLHNEQTTHKVCVADDCDVFVLNLRVLPHVKCGTFY